MGVVLRLYSGYCYLFLTGALEIFVKKCARYVAIPRTEL